MRNNPHYIEAVKSKQLVFEPLPIPTNEDVQPFQDLQIHFPLSEEENDAVCDALEESAKAQSGGQTSEGEITLLYTETSLISREKPINENLGFNESS